MKAAGINAISDIIKVPNTPNELTTQASSTIYSNLPSNVESTLI